MKVRLKVKSFILGGIHESGEIIEVDELDGRVELLEPEAPATKGGGPGRKPRKDDFFDGE